MTTTVFLISAAPGDRVPGHELADPECPQVPGLLERSDVTRWLASVGYGPDSDDELVYLLTEQDPGSVPPGFPHLTVTL